MFFKTKAEKKAFRSGIAVGCKKEKTKQPTDKVKIKNIKVKNKAVLSKNNFDFEEERKLAMLYAEHMGDKWGLSTSEVQKNAKENFARAKTDSKFRSFLYRNYGD